MELTFILVIVGLLYNPSLIVDDNTRHQHSMKNKVYKLIELTGTSTRSIEDAVNTALKRAGKTIQNLGWFQIVETRGSIEKNQVQHWQVTIKVGLTVK